MIDTSKSLKNTHPEIMDKWSPDNLLDPGKVTAGSGKKALFICPNHDFPYEQVIKSAIKGHGCQFCSTAPTKPLVGVNDLATLRPELVEEWSPKNSLQPTEVSLRSGRKVWWICRECSHEWQAIIANRTKLNGTKCPHCKFKTGSMIEHQVRELIPEAAETNVLIEAKNGKSLSVDIVSYPMNLIIEYDGAYWHRDKVAYDIQKTNLLLDLGFFVARIREQSPWRSIDILPIEHPRLLQVKYWYPSKDVSVPVASILSWIDHT